MNSIDKELNKSVKECLAAMAVGIVYMEFLKKDGTLRPARATRCPALIPPRKPSRRQRPPKPGVIPFYDLDKKDWASFKCNRFAGFIPIEPEQEKEDEDDDDFDDDHPNLETAYRGMDANDYQLEEALQSSVF